MHIDCKTLIEALYNTKYNYGTNVFLKYRINEKFIEVNYNDFVQIIEHLSAALYQLGIRKGDRVGMISENMYKWIITDVALIALGAIDVPRGADSTASEILYILQHSEVKYCFVENPKQADKIISIKNELPELKYLVLFTGSLQDIKEDAGGLMIVLYDDLLSKGSMVFSTYEKELKSIRDGIQETDIVTIIYTSGTTGNPKGVILLHKNIVHNVRVLPEIIDIQIGERWLSILPIWHVFERTIEYIIMATAGVLAYSKPAAKYLLPDFAEIKPTFMVSVPRIWEALYQGIVNKIKEDSSLNFLLFLFFRMIGIRYIKSIKIIKNLVPLFKKPFIITQLLKKTGVLLSLMILYPFYILGDKLIFHKIRDKTGGCLRGPISGGGALPEYIDYFFAAIKVEILEGWGLTETAPVIGVRLFERLVSRTVGPVAPEIEIKIGDENGNPLSNQHEKGIIYIRGTNVMAGYYKEPQKTKAVLSDDGWFNTGDLGRLTITNELQLTGRAKDTIVLIGGENVEPGPIEDKLVESPMIFQVMVVGQDKKVLGALIVPAMDNLIEFAGKHKINYKSAKELCKNKQIIEEYRNIIKSKINTKNGFRDYERITHIVLIPEQFEVGSELTYSLKIKRNYITEKYGEIIDKMFKNN